MEFDNEFVVTAPIDEVWRAMLDVERVAPCLPGARVIEQTGDTAYKVAVKVKLGPMSITYKGDVEVVDQDESARRAVMSVKAKEARGQGVADATVEMGLAEDGRQTRGTIHSDVAVSGKAATMGQDVISDVSANLVERFAENLATMLGGGEEPSMAAEMDEPVPAETPAAAAPKPNGTPAGGAAAEQAGGRRSTAGSRASATQTADDEGLSALSIAGSVIASRLRDPRVVAVLLGAITALAFALGRRSAE